MKIFVKLEQMENGEPRKIIVNVHQITEIKSGSDPETSLIVFPDGNKREVNISPDDLLSLIEKNTEQ